MGWAQDRTQEMNVPRPIAAEHRRGKRRVSAWARRLQTAKRCSPGKMRLPRTNIKPVWKSQRATQFHFLCHGKQMRAGARMLTLPHICQDSSRTFFVNEHIHCCKRMHCLTESGTERSCARENLRASKPCQAVGDSLQCRMLRSGCCRRMLRLSLKTRRARTRARPRPRRGKSSGGLWWSRRSLPCPACPWQDSCCVRGKLRMAPLSSRSG